MAEIYHHSVSNKLFLELHSDDITFLVCNRNYEVLQSGQFSLVDEVMMKKIIDDHQVFNQIFGGVELIYGGSPFITIPAQIIESSDRQRLFKLSHKLGNESVLEDGNLDQEVSLIYSTPKAISNVLASKYPNLKKVHELMCLNRWIQKNLSNPNTIFARIDGEVLLIVVMRNGKLTLANYFDVKSHDDIFYFIMLSVEQLNLEVENTSLVFLTCSDAIEDELLKLFANYLKHVKQLAVIEGLQGIGLGISSILACES